MRRHVELIVSNTSSIRFENPIFECVVNDNLFKNQTEVTYFDVHIGGMTRGEDTGVITIPELFRELANRYEQDDQYILKRWSE